MLTLYPNQKGIRIVKARADALNYYNKFNLSSLNRALTSLSPSAFKLWAYLNSQQNNYEFGLSGEVVSKLLSMSRPTYNKAVHELIDKSYLVMVELYPNLKGYLFFEAGYGGEALKKTTSQIKWEDCIGDYPDIEEEFNEALKIL